MADEVLLCAAALSIALKKGKNKKKKRSKWSKQWLLKRQQLSHVNLLEELRLEPEDWLNYLRMDERTYTELLQIVTPQIERMDTVMRKAISPHERICATLRFLATGRSYADLKFSCAISRQALGEIIPDTCRAIYEGLKSEYLKFPSSEVEWRKIGMEFEARWQFPNCLGSIDGKHIRISPPPDSGSFFWNYKGYNSVVLLAIANANYEIIYCHIGTNGRVSDGGVIENTQFYTKLINEELKLPTPTPAKQGTMRLPWVFIGDEAFSLRKDLLKPFGLRDLPRERKIYNYRLSRARRIIENVFGIMAARFRILHTGINLKLARIDLVIMTCAVLHNYLRRKCSDSYTPADSLDQEDWTQSEVRPGLRVDSSILYGLQLGPNRHNTQEANEVRELYVQYFNGEGRVTWQNNMIH